MIVEFVELRVGSVIESTRNVTFLVICTAAPTARPFTIGRPRFIADIARLPVGTPSIRISVLLAGNCESAVTPEGAGHAEGFPAAIRINLNPSFVLWRQSFRFVCHIINSWNFDQFRFNQFVKAAFVAVSSHIPRLTPPVFSNEYLSITRHPFTTLGEPLSNFLNCVGWISALQCVASFPIRSEAILV